MANSIDIYITNKITGKNWSLSPYNPHEGVRGAPEYWVPTYKMKMTDCSVDFKVIRFGIKRTNMSPPPKKRICNVGLFKKNTYNAVWIPSYRVHSGPGSIPGAWQLYNNFLIHEGSPDPQDAWGTYGCIEVVGRGEWARFIKSIKRVTKTTNYNASRSKLVKVHVAQASAPFARLK